MRRAQRLALAATAASLAFLFVGASIAEAKHRKPVRQAGRSLTVHGRPFTDSGNKVPVGSQSNYVRDGARVGGASTFGHAPNSYGAETLPGQFELPGARPQFSF